MTSLKEWIEKKLKDKDIIYFEYSEFDNIDEIGKGRFGIVSRADLTRFGIQVALKMLFKKENSKIGENDIKELVDELNLLRMVHFHPNINRFLGITKHSGNYAMVLEYANGGNLRDYLENNFTSLQWKHKIQMALEITYGLKCLQSKGIIHRDLHSKNILVNDGKLMIADFGLSKQSAEISSNSSLYGMPAYVEPQRYIDNNYKRDERSDIYSLGVLLWEITSGYPPFHNIDPITTAIQIREGKRETPVKNAPLEYQQLYQRCWSAEPNLRPVIDEVHEILTHLRSQYNTNEPQTTTHNLSSDKDSSLISSQNLSSDKDSSLISSQNLSIDKDSSLISYSDSLKINVSEHLNIRKNNIKQNDVPSNTTLNNSLHKIIQAYSKRNEIGWTRNRSFERVLRKYKSKSDEIFTYLINNPVIQNYEVIVGKFYAEGFGVNLNYDKAFEWYMKGIKKNDTNGHYEVGYSYYHGYGIEQNYEKSFEFYECAGLNIALFNLAAYCEDESKAFELYKKSAKNGFIPSQCELADCYKDGRGIQENKREALKWYKLYQENNGYNNISKVINDIEEKLEQEEIQQLNNALDEIIQAYLKHTNIGRTKNFSFDKVLEKYKSNSQDIFNHLIKNPVIQHCEVMIGKFYMKGFGVNFNYNKAFEWYMKGIKKNDTNCHYEVGYSYYHGYGIKQNYKKSFEFYECATTNGLNIALFNLAAYCKDESKAFELYKKSAKNGFIPSQRELADCYKDGKGTQENKREALKWYKLYQENNGYNNISKVINDIEEKLEQEELSDALDEIIRDYLTFTNVGWTKNFNFNKILEKFRSKSRKIFNYLINNPTIQHYEIMVGKFYEQGFGVVENKYTAFGWYLRASQQNNINGHYEAGNLYYTEENHEKGFEFYQLAAIDELNIALYRLALCYEINEDKYKAFELYKKSAENGFIPSQYKLANYYKDVQENEIEALEWYKLYQKNDGNLHVSSLIKDIKEKLKLKEIQELSNALDEIIQAYLKHICIGWTKSFSFDEVLKKYESKSRKIFNYLIDNPNIQNYEVMVGKFYEKGFGIDKNINIAIEWYMEKDDRNGHYEAGNSYYIEENLEKGFEFYQLAIIDGLNIALYEFANFCEIGSNDIEKNESSAFILYKDSAEIFIPSQFKIAHCYDYGKGTQVNKAEALKWYKLYQENDGDIDVSNRIIDVEKEVKELEVKK